MSRRFYMNHSRHGRKDLFAPAGGSKGGALKLAGDRSGPNKAAMTRLYLARKQRGRRKPSQLVQRIGQMSEVKRQMKESKGDKMAEDQDGEGVHKNLRDSLKKFGTAMKKKKMKVPPKPAAALKKELLKLVK
jgi:hypothetical protein